MSDDEARDDERDEIEREDDEARLFSSLDGERNLLTPLWRDADLLG